MPAVDYTNNFYINGNNLTFNNSWTTTTGAVYFQPAYQQTPIQVQYTGLLTGGWLQVGQAIAKSYKWKPISDRTQAALNGWVTRRSNKAKRLLLNYLSDAQKDELEKFDTVTFISQHGNTYRVSKARSWGVRKLEGDMVTLRACAHPSEAVPDYDTMLAQMMWLQTDEDAFLKIANKKSDNVVDTRTAELIGSLLDDIDAMAEAA